MADSPQTINMVEDEHNPYVNGMLEAAQTFADQKEAIIKKIAANRESLRNMQTQRFMSPEQSKSVDAFYPKREPKPADNGAAATADKPAPAAAAKK